MKVFNHAAEILCLMLLLFIFWPQHGIVVGKFRKAGEKKIVLAPIPGEQTRTAYLFIDDEDFIVVVDYNGRIKFKKVKLGWFNRAQPGDWFWSFRSFNAEEEYHVLKRATGAEVRDNALPTVLWRETYFDHKDIRWRDL